MFSGSGPREFWNSWKNSLFLRPNEDIVLLWGPQLLLFLSNLLAQIYVFVKVGHSRKKHIRFEVRKGHIFVFLPLVPFGAVVTSFTGSSGFRLILYVQCQLFECLLI